MPIRRSIPLIIALIAIGSTALTPSPVGAETITLAADVWCPFNCNPGGDPPGYMVEVAKAVFEPRGHTVTYRVLPWARAVAFPGGETLPASSGHIKRTSPTSSFPTTSWR